MKRCKGCGVEKPLEDFSRQRLGKLGRRSRCRECIKIEAAAYRARTIEKRTAYNRRYRAQNREQRLAYNKAWNQAHRDRCDAATDAWRKRNPEMTAAQRSRRRARKRLAPGADYTTSEKVVHRLAFYGSCYYCGAEHPDTVDHRIPISRGGYHLPANLVPACRSCNSRKSAKTEREYLALTSQRRITVPGLGVSPLPHG